MFLYLSTNGGTTQRIPYILRSSYLSLSTASLVRYLQPNFNILLGSWGTLRELNL